MPARSSRPARTPAASISSRTSAVALTCAVLVVLAIAGIVPQEASPKAAEGVWARADVRGVVTALALDRILTTWPAAVVFAAAALSMAVATGRQVRLAYARTFGVKPRGHPAVTGDVAALRIALRTAGFIRTAREDGVEKHVRNPWGHWGGVVLHAGLLLTLGAGLGLSLTEARGITRLAETESFGPASVFAAEQHGLLAAIAAVPETFTVTAASAGYWPDHTPRQVETTLAFSARDTVGIRVNAPIVRRGVRYYQGQAHGHSFLVTLARDGAVRRLRLDIAAPDSPDAAAYFGSAVEEREYGIRAKYFLDETKRSMNGVPLLALRLERDGEESAVIELRPGGSGRIGPYDVRLEDALVWTELIVVRDHGLPLLLLGFVLAVTGSALLYLSPPVAVQMMAREDGRYDVTWETSRFARALPEALASLMERKGDAA